MSNSKTPPQKTRLSPEQRSRRIQQILFSVLALIVVVSMIITAFLNP